MPPVLQPRPRRGPTPEQVLQLLQRQRTPTQPAQAPPPAQPPDEGFLARGGTLGGAITGAVVGGLTAGPLGAVAGGVVGAGAGALGAPTGFQVGTGLGISNPAARFAVDMIADPTNLAAFGALGGLTKLGKAAASRDALMNASKVGSALRRAVVESQAVGPGRLDALSSGVEDILKASENPALAIELRRAVLAKDTAAAGRILKQINGLGLSDETKRLLPSKSQLKSLIQVVDAEASGQPIQGLGRTFAEQAERGQRVAARIPGADLTLIRGEPLMRELTRVNSLIRNKLGPRAIFGTGGTIPSPQVRQVADDLSTMPAGSKKLFSADPASEDIVVPFQDLKSADDLTRAINDTTPSRQEVVPGLFQEVFGFGKDAIPQELAQPEALRRYMDVRGQRRFRLQDPSPERLRILRSSGQSVFGFGAGAQPQRIPGAQAPAAPGRQPAGQRQFFFGPRSKRAAAQAQAAQAPGGFQLTDEFQPLPEGFIPPPGIELRADPVQGVVGRLKPTKPGRK